MIPSKPKEILRLIQEIESKHESELTELDHENLRVLSAHFEILNVPKYKTILLIFIISLKFPNHHAEKYSNKGG